MQSYDRFVFESYDFRPKEKKIELNYSLDSSTGLTTGGDVKFTETIYLPFLPKQQNTVRSPQLDAALFALHLIGGISYYKTCLPKTIEIKSGALTMDQADFWNDVYENGLGEFFFKNKIDFRGLIRFPSSPPPLTPPPRGEGKRSVSLPQSGEGPGMGAKVLVPIGGGKDSLVTLELLKKAGIDVTLFRMGAHPFIDTMAGIAKTPLLTVERRLDGALFDLNAQGALNGHVPITAYLSILSVIVAMLMKHTAVVLSNERSASEGNTELFGKQINHQWSKSLEFEKALQKYLKTYVGTGVEYFSLLRPLSELHITKLLTQYPEYLTAFTSCNANWRIVKEKPTEPWCKKCPKCAFAFALLSAYMPKPSMLRIFGGNLFEDASLLPLYKELLGLEGHKPFECVGTPEETEAALLLAHDRGEFEGTPVMDLYVKEVRSKRKDPEDVVASLLMPSAEHAIPPGYTSLIPKA
jgi:UDP-N-acetyl-alpha-D-muramoyl-L-alanyl-L-glutamate epimerase